MDQEEPVVLPSNIIQLDELADKLWNKYFKPKEPLSLAQRKSLMNEYNLVAARRNNLSNFKALLTITPSMRIEYKGDEKDFHPPGLGSPTRMPSTFIPEKTVNPVSKDMGTGIIAQILKLHDEGLSNKDIIARGFNKSTVARQVGEYKKRKENGQH